MLLVLGPFAWAHSVRTPPNATVLRPSHTRQLTLMLHFSVQRVSVARVYSVQRQPFLSEMLPHHVHENIDLSMQLLKPLPKNIFPSKGPDQFQEKYR